MMQKLPRVIALCGARRTGKDTIANYLVFKYGYEHIKITTPLKEICKVLFQFTDEQLETDLKETVDKRWGVSPRQVMQFVGTDMFQYKIQELMPDVGRRFWINSLVEHIRTQPDKRYVISDLRFHHEMDALGYFMPYIIKVVSNRIQKNNTDTHVSECEQKEIKENIYVTNNDTIEDLYKKMDDVFSMFDNTM